MTCRTLEKQRKTRLCLVFPQHLSRVLLRHSVYIIVQKHARYCFIPLIKNKPETTHALIGLVPFYKTEQKSWDEVTQRQEKFFSRMEVRLFSKRIKQIERKLPSTLFKCSPTSWRFLLLSRNTLFYSLNSKLNKCVICCFLKMTVIDLFRDYNMLLENRCV